MEKSLASEMEGNGGHETTYLGESEAEIGSGLDTVSEEI